MMTKGKLLRTSYIAIIFPEDRKRNRGARSCTETPKTSIKSNLGANKELNAFNKTCILMNVSKTRNLYKNSTV